MNYFRLLIFIIPFLAFAQEKNSIQYIDFHSVEADGEFDSIAWNQGDKIRYEFDLKGSKSIKCALTINNSANIVFDQFLKHKWQTIDTLTYNVFADVTPALMITDFDSDGNEDFMYWSHTNVNGNMWISIYLNHPDKHKLLKLETTPADEDIWCDPTYDPETRIISTRSVSGNYGISAESTYRLVNKVAIPIYKEESDNTKMSSITGKGGIIKIYNGVKGKWKLKKKVKN
ncbi:hypothetical protein Q765_01245 [Flavobacterium rivuli WB 3.3-2 = DSM 21788]|uniref:Uncharacterized protein n=1 Tax=Flavobacterium rivuli WB 3.3-2 = DSM 21788 TaxID=1121895 RepID=A0A0A2M7C3_9FLAO|nr:hypothetical protein [Flavobacterium rivuli]KGO88562.1 hypothetical protein Q765_01245 [Flavobacterium rivuli WB 3.3-2 = DSM 21788]